MQLFVTKLGIVVHHQEPECHAKKWDSIFKVKTSESFASKLNLCVDHHKQRRVQ